MVLLSGTSGPNVGVYEQTNKQKTRSLPHPTPLAVWLVHCGALQNFVLAIAIYTCNLSMFFIFNG